MGFWTDSKYLCKFAILLVLGSFLIPAKLLAADMVTAKSPYGEPLIVISGDIELHDDDKFATVSSTVEKANVWLMSNGGSTLAALNIGTSIRMKGWSTVVPRDATCASACALIWVSGSSRSVGIGARVGFHATYVVREGVSLELGVGNAIVGAYLNKLGIRDQAVIFMTSAPPTSIAWLSAQDARDVGLNASFNTPETMTAPSRQIVDANPFGGKPASPTPIPPAQPEIQTDRSPFLSEDQMLSYLYRGFPNSITSEGKPFCGDQKCSIRLRHKSDWTGADGKLRQMVIAVTETENGCHACSAILGAAVFRREGSSWTSEVSTPSITRVGSFGTYNGKIGVLHLPGFDPVIELPESEMHMGKVDVGANLVASFVGNFKSLLVVDTGHATGGYCDPAEEQCRQNIAASDFEAKFSITADQRGLDVVQIPMSGMLKVGKTWHVDHNGHVVTGLANQISTPSATLPPGFILDTPSFLAGAADRKQYESWFDGLVGDRKDGALFWAENRSLRPIPSCAIKPLNAGWTSGCIAGQQILNPSDIKRKADPEYRRGWNSI